MISTSNTMIPTAAAIINLMGSAAKVVSSIFSFYLLDSSDVFLLFLKYI